MTNLTDRPTGEPMVTESNRLQFWVSLPLAHSRLVTKCKIKRAAAMIVGTVLIWACPKKEPFLPLRRRGGLGDAEWMGDRPRNGSASRLERKDRNPVRALTTPYSASGS